jgi:tight adherence protein B
MTSLLDRAEEGADPVEQFLSRSPLAIRTKHHIQQAGLNWSLSRLLLTMSAAALAGLLIGLRFPILLHWGLTSFVLVAVLASVPPVYIWWKRRCRLDQIQEQLPEALDFLARSMRAGHAFTISLAMLGDESPEPLGLEFRTLFNEQNLGGSLEAAMQNLVQRVPLADVRFFASSVLLQKQTGGNLSEILTRLAYLIRERFRLRGQVRAASAHGRITALVLTALPVATMIGLLVMAPGYLQSMAADADGKYFIAGAIAAQFVGYYCMRRIINIKV